MNQDEQEDQECPPTVFCKETVILMDFFNIKPNIFYVLESIRDKVVNYNNVSDLDSNQDDQVDQEFPPSVFCKETGFLMVFFTLNSTHATYLESLG